MNGGKILRGFLRLLVVVVAGITGYALQQPIIVFAQATSEQGWIRAGLQLEIQSVDFNPPACSVTFRIFDDKGKGLDRLGADTPGPVDFDFIIARIKPGDLQYTNYITRRVTDPETGATADQPSPDSNGTFTSLGDGVYKYTFAFQFPTNFEKDSTHTLAMKAVRNLKQFGLGFARVDGVSDFVPSGKPVTQIRDVVRTENCERCHDFQTKVHRTGFSRNVRRCILCHTPQNMDPYTGNSLDMKVLIHKIHRGANLPT